MKSRLNTSVAQPGLALPPILLELNVVAAAVINRNGILEEANPGFMRVLPNIVGAGTLRDVRGFFINPRFDQFAAKGGNSDNGAIYRGVVNIGDAMGAVRSLRGTIYALGEKLLIVVEPDIAEIEKSLAALESLNAQLSGERHSTAEVMAPHGGRSSARAKSSPRPSSSPPADCDTARPITNGPKAPSGQPLSDTTAGTMSSALIPVNVAIALMRIGLSSKSK